MSVVMHIVFAVGLALSVAACAAPLQVTRGADPSDPSVAVAPARYASPFASYRSQRPVEPSDWRGSNERVAPKREPSR